MISCERIYEKIAKSFIDCKPAADYCSKPSFNYSTRECNKFLNKHEKILPMSLSLNYIGPAKIDFDSCCYHGDMSNQEYICKHQLKMSTEYINQKGE